MRIGLTFDEIFAQIEEHLCSRDLIRATSILDRALLKPSLSEETRSSCLHWLGICHAAMAIDTLYKHGEPEQAQVGFETAGAAFREALSLNPNSISVRLSLARLALQTGEDPSEVLGYLAPIADVSADSFADLSEVHAAFMMLATACCMVSRFTEGMKHYRFALSGCLGQKVQEPDLSSFAYLRAYGMPVPRDLKEEVLGLIGRFKVVNDAGLSEVRQLAVINNWGEAQG